MNYLHRHDFKFYLFVFYFFSLECTLFFFFFFLVCKSSIMLYQVVSLSKLESSFSYQLPHMLGLQWKNNWDRDTKNSQTIRNDTDMASPTRLSTLSITMSSFLESRYELVGSSIAMRRITTPRSGISNSRIAMIHKYTSWVSI